MELSGHTMVIGHQISELEVNRICKMYGATACNEIVIVQPCSGINKLRITRNMKKDGYSKETLGFRYSMYLEVNLPKLLGTSNILMLELSDKNIDRVMRKLNKILPMRFYLLYGNSLCEDWKVYRLDAGEDVGFEGADEDVMKERIGLMHKSYQPDNRCHCRYKKYNGYDNPQVQQESITLCNNSYTYNIYYKYLEVLKKSKHYSMQDLEEARNIIRIEKQMERAYLKRNGVDKLSDLKDATIRMLLLDGIVSDMEKIFGAGIHVTLNAAVSEIEQSNYDRSEKDLLIKFCDTMNRFGYAGFIDLYLAEEQGHSSQQEISNVLEGVKELRQMLETLEMSVAFCTGRDENELQSIAEILKSMNTSRQEPCRKKEKFSKPRLLSGRLNTWGCRPTLHYLNGESELKDVYGRSCEDVEYKVFEMIDSGLKLHLLGAPRERHEEYLLNAKTDLINFKTVVESQKISDRIDMAITWADKYLKNLREDFSDENLV